MEYPIIIKFNDADITKVIDDKIENKVTMYLVESKRGKKFWVYASKCKSIWKLVEEYEVKKPRWSQSQCDLKPKRRNTRVCYQESSDSDPSFWEQWKKKKGKQVQEDEEEECSNVSSNGSLNEFVVGEDKDEEEEEDEEYVPEKDTELGKQEQPRKRLFMSNIVDEIPKKVKLQETGAFFQGDEPHQIVKYFLNDDESEVLFEVAWKMRKRTGVQPKNSIVTSNEMKAHSPHLIKIFFMNLQKSK